MASEKVAETRMVAGMIIDARWRKVGEPMCALEPKQSGDRECENGRVGKRNFENSDEIRSVRVIGNSVPK
jgi:hypothetical protein